MPFKEVGVVKARSLDPPLYQRSHNVEHRSTAADITRGGRRQLQGSGAACDTTGYRIADASLLRFPAVHAHVMALQATAGLAQQSYSVDSSANFSFTVRNSLPREVVIYGDGCILKIELQNTQGLTVFPSGAPAYLSPLEAFRVSARN